MVSLNINPRVALDPNTQYIVNQAITNPDQKNTEHTDLPDSGEN